MNTKSSRLGELSKTPLSKFLLPQLVVTRKSLQKDIDMNDLDLDSILDSKEGFTTFVVRSSAKIEDIDGSSQAGRFVSLLDIPFAGIKEAIGEVLASYDEADDYDEVLIQPYISNSTLSGVVFTHDPSTGSPYRVFNFSEGSDTTAVTSGKSNSVMVVVYRDSLDLLPHPIKRYLPEFKQVMDYFKDPVDIEFVCKENDFFIVQYRPLSTKTNETDSNILVSAIQEVKAGIARIMEPHPYLAGKATILGVMPDWNPAELIGVRPSALALSLFRELITDGIWAYERDNLGYRNTRSFPLLVTLAGHPYVDIRTSVNSLIPATLDGPIAEKLANCYLDFLRQHPHFHDKVEFEVYLTAWSFDYQRRVEKYSSELTTDEILQLEEELLSLTRRMISKEVGHLPRNSEKFEVLSARFEKIVSSDLDSLSKLYWLIEDCKRYGTLPFSGVARLAFVGTLLLKSLEEAGYLNSLDLELLLSRVESPAKRLLQDAKSLDRKTFIARYGHLRPGTFDIRVLNYSSGYESYFNESYSSSLELQSVFVDDDDSYRGCVKRLEASSSLGVEVRKLGIEITELIDWCVSAIGAREEGKFLLSRNISAALDLISDIGNDLGFDPDDLANSSISTYIEAYKGSADLQTRLSTEIWRNREFFKTTSSIWLPPLIANPSEVNCFKLYEGQPNFVGQASISGIVKVIQDGPNEISDKIVLISSADPGFDWIFTHGIRGLITCFGGANSHMAVRCKELGIPAAIGVGEILYNNLARVNSVLLDCMGKRIEVIN